MALTARAYDRNDYQTNSEFTSVTVITDCLYLTNKAGGLSVKTLRRLRITHIICAAESHEVTEPQYRCDFKRIPVPKDPSGPNIIQYFEEVADFIETVDKRGGRVLIQSLNGVSRGPTLAMAYLMKYKRMTLSEAYGLICKERPCIKPYVGFWKQLIRYEEQLLVSVSERYDGRHEDRDDESYEDGHDKHQAYDKYGPMGSSSSYDRDDYQTSSEFTRITSITKSLYLTNRAGGLSKGTLRRLGIDFIICAAESFEIDPPSKRCDFKRIPVPKDRSGPNIIQYFDEVADAIDVVDSRGGRVLIQSLNGVSRGPTLAIAYLMKHKGMSLSKAFKLVSKERPCIKPYLGFWKQLIRYEKKIFGTTSASY